MSREEYLRFHSVRRWVEQCVCSGGKEPVLDVSDRWNGTVYGQIISPSRLAPVKGTLEMLSTHYLLISSDSDAVLFSIEVDAVKSFHRVDHTHLPSGNLAGANPRTSSRRDSDDDEGRPRVGASFLRTVVELLVAPVSEVGRVPSPDGTEVYGEEDLIKIIVSLDGPDGRHFAAGMEMLWRLRFEQLTPRERAISRSCHTSDLVFILSMMPLDVSCELLQIQEPQPSVQQQQSASRRIFGLAAASPMSITNVSKPVNFRVDETYQICIVFRPDTAYAGLAAAHGADPESAELPQPSTVFLRTISFHIDAVLLITVANNQLRVALRSGVVYTFGSLDLFGLDRDKSSGFSTNPLTSGSPGVSGERPPGSPRTSLSPLGSPRGNDTFTSDRGSSSNFNATFTSPLSPRFPQANGVEDASKSDTGGLDYLPPFESPPLVKGRKRTADEFTKAVSSLDVGSMSRGVRCVLDVYLLFVATSCYQSLYLRAASAPNIGKDLLKGAYHPTSGTDEDPLLLEPGKVTRDHVPSAPLPDYIPNRRCFRGNDLYIVYQHFLNVDTNYDGYLSSAEFLTCIGPALVGSDGALPRAVYSLFDVLHNNVVQLAEYFFGCRVLLKGSVDDRLLFLFNGLFDTQQRGSIDYQQFHNGMSYVSKVLRLKGEDLAEGGGVPIGDPSSPDSAKNLTASSSNNNNSISRGGGGGGIFSNRGVTTKVATHGDVLVSDKQLRDFTRSVFRSIDTNGDNNVDFQEFRTGMTRNQGVLKVLQLEAPQETIDGVEGADGLARFSKDDPSKDVGNPLKVVSFGHPRWKEIVLILAGIEASVSSTESTDKVVSEKSFGEKVIHDCTQFGNIAPNVEALLGSLGPASGAAATVRGQLASTSPTTPSTDGGDAGGSPPSQPSSSSSPRSSKTQTVLFNDYCPAVFSAIRRTFGISRESYMKSLGLQHLRSNLLFGSLNALFAMSSSGRSGSFFYASHDFKFILKTIPGSESEMLRKILPSYYAHIVKNEHTLLTRFCGLHALHVDGKKLNFVVMQNIFQNKIPVHVSYDLKGSTVNRSTPNFQRGPGVALKDNDFGKRRVYIGAELKAQLMRQIDADSALLTSHNLNDYSFLLGVHESIVGPLPMPDRQSCPSPSHNIFQRFHGGVEGRRPIDLKADPNPQLSAMHSENQVWTMGDDHADDSGDEWTVVRRESLAEEMQTRKQSTARLPSGGGSIGGWHGQEVLEHAAASSGTSFTDKQNSENTTGDEEPQSPKSAVQYEVYFMGVIDILTDYGMKKKGEHYSKAILYDSKQVSCVPPVEYRQRFLQYLNTIIVGL